MPTLSELQQQSNDAEHQAFQRAYDALLDIAKDPITCRHFWDAGFTAGQADANDMLPVAHMDGHARGRDSMRRELVEAADAVVKRWDSPLWKDAPHTGDYIARLRAALAKFGEKS